MDSKVKSSFALRNALASLKKRRKKIVFTNGCFDILHRGHVEYLARARRLGDALVVGINSDRSVRSIKGKGRPINKARDRAAVLSALAAVDYVTIFDEDTPAKLIAKLRPDVVAKGGDWKIKDIVGSDLVISYGGLVFSLPFVDGYSTTTLVRKMARA
jgi:D-beta-D-heptose 7-phosphate kinase/D-beta-D-heptose 1-phosphate adenosyltransferase